MCVGGLPWDACGVCVFFPTMCVVWGVYVLLTCVVDTGKSFLAGLGATDGFRAGLGRVWLAVI